MNEELLRSKATLMREDVMEVFGCCSSQATKIMRKVKDACSYKREEMPMRGMIRTADLLRTYNIELRRNE